MAKRKDITAERQRKAQLWTERVSKIAQLDEAEAQKLLSFGRTQSLRLNQLKVNEHNMKRVKSQDLLVHSFSWCSHGYKLKTTEIENEIIDEGLVYIQNASSWLPVLALDPKPGESILDVCAAPGGKSSHIQAIAGNEAHLLCNDNSKPRLMKLKANMERLGATAEYSLHDATKLTRYITPESIDKILIDAPCSGEGFLTLLPEDSKLFDSWSVAHIRRLSELQKKIVTESWRLLKPGGTLVYSTCTMAPEENEAIVDYLLRKNDDAKLERIEKSFDNAIEPLTSWNNRPYRNDLTGCLRLLPSKYLEAFFVAKITKSNR